MTPLRTICLVLLCLSAGACRAADTDQQATPKKTAKAKPFRLPFLFDGAGVLLTDGNSKGWYGTEIQFRVGVDRVFKGLLPFAGEKLELHQLTFDAGWQRGFGISPNPQRFWVTTGYSIAGDFYSGYSDSQWPFSLSKNGAFPMARTLLFSGGVGAAVGYHYSEGTQLAHAHDGLDHRSAVRFQNWAFIGVAIFELRVEGALNLNLDPGVFAEPEFSIGLRVPRPISPVFVHIGWTWLPFEQGGGSYFTVKLGAVF